MGELSGQLVVVTGGSMGIGLACAREVAARGADVFLAARGRSALDVAAADIRARSSVRVGLEPVDVGVPGDVERLFREVAEFGTVSAVIHAAGIYGPVGPVADIDVDAWARAIRVNLVGSFLVARAACRAFRRVKTGGSIVLLAGGGAASPFPRYSAYASSKVAVVRLAETLALEVADERIRVNAMAPGFVATRLHAQTIAAGELAGTFLETTKKQLAEGSTPPEVPARVAAFLISPRAGHITGRFVAAPYDDVENWIDHAHELRDGDLFTLRRIVPKDRGKSWQ